MNGRRWSAGIAALIAPGFIAATRIPAQQEILGLVALAAAIGATLLGVAAAVRPNWRWPNPLGLASGIVLLAIPASPTAMLAGLPAALVVLPALVFFHLLYPFEAEAAPKAGQQASRILGSTLRLAPFAAGVLFITAFPWLARSVLPPRLGAVHELAGPLAAIVAAALVTTTLAALALLRAASTMRSRPRPQPMPATGSIPDAEATP